MKQYSCPLLALLLSIVSSFMCVPCHAQVATEAKSELDNNDSPQKTSLNKNEVLPVNSAEDSANIKSTVISDNSETTAAVTNNQANTQPTLRIPINSRIFASPSMQQ
ncbi:hypothetical protein IQ244_01730 [Nostoc sp. LEGE 06077]|uniref:hypothetical protein n=1 Tax=Nostoc sp. LEGE 06077 TaxID=915325 RepID=UPI001881B327|nr:hypothetical protein [Nostoc sp. LEGE 06077]MBE9205268.1 hypothetical protein [Nostoc sp. LEGE 06077]